MKRAIKYSISDDDADSLIQEAKAEYEKNEKKVIHKMDEIMADQSRVKEYIHDYVTQIVLFKPDDSWVLVVVQFLDVSKRWGTIKTERYSHLPSSGSDYLGFSRSHTNFPAKVA